MTDRKRKLDIYETAPAGVTVMPPASQPTVNPYTGRGYSQKYFDILAKRKGKAFIHWSTLYSPHAALLNCWAQALHCWQLQWRSPPPRAKHAAGPGGCHKAWQHGDGHEPLALQCRDGLRFHVQVFRYGRHARSSCR